MLPDGQLLVVGRAGDRPVYACEPTTAGLVPGPDLRRRVFGGIGHVRPPGHLMRRAHPARAAALREAAFAARGAANPTAPGGTRRPSASRVRPRATGSGRSEEHTSGIQSLMPISYA